VPGACLHGGAQLDGPESALAPVAASVAENLNNLVFPHLETLPRAVTSGPKIASLASVWSSPAAHRRTKRIRASTEGAVSPKGAGCLPRGARVRGDQKKVEKGELFEGSPCYQMWQLHTFGKVFSKGLEQGANFKN